MVIQVCCYLIYRNLWIIQFINPCYDFPVTLAHTKENFDFSENDMSPERTE